MTVSSHREDTAPKQNRPAMGRDAEIGGTTDTKSIGSLFARMRDEIEEVGANLEHHVRLEVAIRKASPDRNGSYRGEATDPSGLVAEPDAGWRKELLS